ncbi:MAG: transporter substrate-binding domain-containing protein [Oscillospiraceae bacterium]|nr:transporter substrate-binding domain-containing protein [Oscillospiraceae bacterium]
MKKVTLVFVIALLAALLAGCRPAPPPNTVFTLEDVPGKVIGAMGGTPSERLASELGQARAFVSGEEMMYSLNAGLIDCAVMESTVAGELVANTAGVRTLSDPLLIYDLRFALPRENDELLKVVDAALATLRSNGTLRGLRDKYFSGRRYTYTPPTGVEQRPGTLTLAVPPDSPPFSIMDAEGVFSGLDIEVARAVCDILGVRLEIIEYDAWELVTAVRYGRAEMALGWLPSEGEEQLIHISEPYADVEHVVVVRR